jgi:[acyl-carrier-protein] S-malonyltransferase
MGRDVADAFPAARAVFDRADAALSLKLSDLCFEGPADRLNATDVSQPAIFVTSVAMWAALESAGIAREMTPGAMAGLSLGEYTALHLAGWIEFEDALRLVARRGRLMQDAAESNPGSMVSLIGATGEDAEALCQAAADGEVLTPANFNCPGQIVVSGSKAACDRALRLAEARHLRAVPLVVAGAFHSALMSSATEGLVSALNTTTIQPGEIPVVSNVTADYHGDPDSVRTRLADQVSRPVLWQATIERLVRDGFDRFVEVGPGRVLTGLMRKIDRSVATTNYSTAAAMEGVSA